MNERNDKGITLIALVITIIILLILAGLSIQILAGENGLIKRTVKSKQLQEDAEEKELVELAVSSAKIDGEGNIITDNLNKALNETFNNGTKVTEISEGWNYQGKKLYKIYSNGKVEEMTEEKIILPSGYQQVEYLESTGTQYIDTNIIPTLDTSMEAVLACTDSNASNVNWCGSVLSGYQGWFAIGSYGSGYLVSYIGNGERKGATIPFDTEFHKYYVSNGEQRIDDIISDNTISSFGRTMLSIYFFRGNNDYSSVTATKQKIKYVKIFESNQLKHHFIPCYLKSDTNQRGLYDVIENNFYTNCGEGIFEIENIL